MELNIEENDTEDAQQSSPSANDQEDCRESVYSQHSNCEQIVDDNADLLSEEESDNDSMLLLKERQKTFERINRTMEKNIAQWKRLQEDMKHIKLSDDSHSHLIEGRIDEIKSMCCSLIRPEYILDSQNPDIKEYALALKPVSRRSFEYAYRDGWKKIDIFRYAARMAMTYSSLAMSHLKYPWWEETKRPESVDLSNHSLKTIKYSINRLLRLSLTTHPKYRSKQSIQQVLWFNRAIGAFADLFPVEMEKELARYISYEIYDDGRVIRCQGDVPQKLYYILAGKIEMVKVYRLSQGEVHKSMGFLTHKQITDFVDFQNGTVSPTYLVARHRLEVLSLHKEDYSNLSNETNLDSIRDFIHQIGIFKDMPVTSESLKSHLLKIQYYKNEAVITSNSLKETFIYIVKSGKVSVARQQIILDKSISSLLSSSDVYSLGCKRDNTHASAMQVLPKRQKNGKEILLDKSKTMHHIERKKPNNFIKPHTMIGSFEGADEEVSIIGDNIVRSRTLFDTKSPGYILGSETHKKVTEILSGVSKETKPERQAYVKLDSLKPLDIFGLDSIEDMSGISRSKLVLISEGAEVLMINKRYFLESVNNNTLLEIRKLIKNYLSEEEARVIIDEDMKWRAYKKVLMERMVSLHC